MTRSKARIPRPQAPPPGGRACRRGLACADPPPRRARSLARASCGRAGTGGQGTDSTGVVERAARDVDQDYIGVTGTPAKSDATAAEYARPLWNSWAQFYSDVT